MTVHKLFGVSISHYVDFWVGLYFVSKFKKLFYTIRHYQYLWRSFDDIWWWCSIFWRGPLSRVPVSSPFLGQHYTCAINKQDGLPTCSAFAQWPQDNFLDTPIVPIIHQSWQGNSSQLFQLLSTLEQCHRALYLINDSTSFPSLRRKFLKKVPPCRLQCGRDYLLEGHSTVCHITLEYLATAT